MELFFVFVVLGNSTSKIHQKGWLATVFSRANLCKIHACSLSSNSECGKYKCRLKTNSKCVAKGNLVWFQKNQTANNCTVVMNAVGTKDTLNCASSRGSQKASKRQENNSSCAEKYLSANTPGLLLFCRHDFLTETSILDWSKMNQLDFYFECFFRSIFFMPKFGSC